MANESGTRGVRRSSSGISPITLVISTVAVIWLACNTVSQNCNLLYTIGFLVFLAQLILGVAALFFIMRADEDGRLEGRRAQAWSSTVFALQAVVLAFLALVYSADGAHKLTAITVVYASANLALCHFIRTGTPRASLRSIRRHQAESPGASDQQ